MKIMDWPLQSPDPQPHREHLGKWKINGQIYCTFIGKAESQKAWDNISVEVLRKYINTVQRDVLIAVLVTGGLTAH